MTEGIVTMPVPGLPMAIEWKLIPAGRFEMGCDLRPDAVCRDDERPRHIVTLARTFQLAASETSLAQYRSYATSTGAPVPEQPPWI